METNHNDKNANDYEMLWKNGEVPKSGSGSSSNNNNSSSSSELVGETSFVSKSQQ